MLKKQKIGTEHDKSVSTYFNEVAGYKPLSKDEELELWRNYKYNGDLKARDRLISSNLKFVASIAKQYQGRGLSYADLISEGNIGLMKALDKFDGERGYKVISYSVWWIRQTILEALSKRNTSEDEDLPFDFEKPVETDDDDYRTEMGDDNFINDGIEENTELERTEAINLLMEFLNQRERNIITKYYGLDGNKPKTLEEIGMEYGLTKERIRQIKNLSFKKMRSVALATGMTMSVF
jgi:RNA polymerase primary sigma factor